MPVTEQQFLQHADQNNAEFSNRQVTVFGNGSPEGITPGLKGWYYIDKSILPHVRYENIGPSATQWRQIGGDGASHNHDDRYYTQAEIDAIISNIVQGTRVLGAVPVEVPDGVVQVFTLPSGDEYMENTLQISVNGLDEGVPNRISSSQFQVPGNALLNGDILRCYYVKSN